MDEKLHLDTIKVLRAAIRLYAPCHGCGNEACEAMHAALAESAGIVDDEILGVVFMEAPFPELLLS